MNRQLSKPALFKAYPELEAKLPWLKLGHFPTPVQHLRNVGFPDVWIKRDDLSAKAYGGNKVRKLEFVLAQVKQQRKTHVITFGGIGTNHGLATAIYAHQLSLACTLVLFPQPVTSLVKQNLRLFIYYGARLIYRPSVIKAVLTYYLTQRLRYPGAYFLFAGGSNAMGTLGFVSAAFELQAQIEAGELPQPSVIICPVGSNGTLAGLTLGAHLAGLDCPVIGVRVSFSHCGPFQSCTPATVRKLMLQTHTVLRKRAPGLAGTNMPFPNMWHDYVGDGYGFPTVSGQQAYRLLKDKQQIVLDPTYTAKTFAAVLDFCRRHSAAPGPVLYWHTYNSVDLTPQAQSVDDRQLPRAFQPFITTPVVDDPIPHEGEHANA